MTIVSEFNILHKNIGFPSEDEFCPFIWESENFDSDGDYYFRGIGDQWTNLDLASFDDGKEAEFEIITYREGIDHDMDLSDLKYYVDKFREKASYRVDMEHISPEDQLAVSNITIEAKNLQMYRKLLETVHFFLEFTNGQVLNYPFCNAAEFKEKFLDDDEDHLNK